MPLSYAALSRFALRLHLVALKFHRLRQPFHLSLQPLRKANLVARC